MNITREIFDEQRHPRFGVSNPERMNLAFWEWMIRDIQKEPIEQDGIFLRLGFADRESRLKPRHSAHGARKHFQVKYDPADGPVWTFYRFGKSETELPDGRIVYIAGEHEDSYDPDFYIYNDVVVLGPNDEIEIYAYPKDVFPPTDFHTATLVGDSIIIIGCIGYVDQRLPGLRPSTRWICKTIASRRSRLLGRYRVGYLSMKRNCKEMARLKLRVAKLITIPIARSLRTQTLKNTLST